MEKDRVYNIISTDPHLSAAQSAPTPHNSLVVHHAFVIRLGYEGDHTGWRGWIQHVASGRTSVVCSAGELIAFVEEHVGNLAEPHKGGLR
jgi:hypothetical protein